MAVVDIACFCHRAIVDVQRQMLTVVDIISEITVTRDGEKNGDPIIVPVDFALASQWTRENRDVPEVVEIQIALEGPKGKVFEPTVMVADLSEKIVARLIVNIPRMDFTQGGGGYAFIFRAKDGASRWKQKAKSSFWVQIAEGASAS